MYGGWKREQFREKWCLKGINFFHSVPPTLYGVVTSKYRQFSAPTRNFSAPVRNLGLDLKIDVFYRPYIHLARLRGPLSPLPVSKKLSDQILKTMGLKTCENRTVFAKKNSGASHFHRPEYFNLCFGEMARFAPFF